MASHAASSMLEEVPTEKVTPLERLYDLEELKQLLASRESGEGYDRARHDQLILTLKYVARSLGLEVPAHWL